MKSRIGSRAWPIWTGVLLFALAGCGGDGTTSEVDSGDVGSLDVELQMDALGNVLVDTVTWGITNAGTGYSNTGNTVDTSSNQLLFFLEVARIPAAAGYILTLTAEAYAPGFPGTIIADCAFTSDPFAINAGLPTPLTVIPICTFRPEATGALEVTGSSADFCPEIDQVVVAAVDEGVAFSVSATASDDDGDPITYDWLPNVDFDDSTAASTVYRCAAAGAATFTLEVTPTTPNGCVADTETVDVTCTGAAP